MTTRKDPEYVVATNTGVVKLGGKLERFTEGKTIIRADAPLAKKLPEYFMPWTPPGSD